MFDFTKPHVRGDDTIWDRQEKSADIVMKQPTLGQSGGVGFFLFVIILVLVIGMAVIWTDGFDDILFYTVEHDEVVVVQSMNGDIEVDDATGFHFKGFGKVTKYPRTMLIGYTETESGSMDQLAPLPEPLYPTFADGDKVGINAVVQIELPTDTESLLNLHRVFVKPENIDRAITMYMNNALRATAVTMTPRELQGHRRHEFGKMFSLQMMFGLAKIQQYEEDGIRKTRILTDENGIPIPAEDDYPIVDETGIKITNAYILGYTFSTDFMVREKARKDAFLKKLQAEAELEVAKAERERIAEQARWQLEYDNAPESEKESMLQLHREVIRARQIAEQLEKIKVPNVIIRPRSLTDAEALLIQSKALNPDK